MPINRPDNASGLVRCAKLTEGAVHTRLIGLTVPMVWGILVIIAFNLVDTFFVGQLGTQELAAFSFTFPVVMVLGSLVFGLGTGSSSVVARAIGEKDHERVQRLATDSLILSVVIVGVVISVGLLTIDPLFRLLGAQPELLPLIRDYMKIWYPGMLFLVIPMVSSGVIRATGDTTFPSLLMTVAAVVNAILDPLLIFGLAGFPRLELQGAAIATVIARGVTLLAALAVLHFRERLLIFCLPPRQRLLDSWKRILHVSLPAAGSAMVNPISVGITISLLAPFGAEAVAAFGIATRIEAFALIVLLALASSIGPFVGQNWGAQQYRRVVEAVRLSSLFSLVWGLLMALLLGINATLIAGVFNDNPDVVAIARLYLLLVPVSYGANGIILLSGAVFNALGKPLPATVITVTRWLILYIPMALAGGYLFGVAGVFAAVCVANFAVGLAAFVWNQQVCRGRVPAV